MQNAEFFPFLANAMTQQIEFVGRLMNEAEDIDLMVIQRLS